MASARGGASHQDGSKVNTFMSRGKDTRYISRKESIFINAKGINKFSGVHKYSSEEGSISIQVRKGQ